MEKDKKVEKTSFYVERKSLLVQLSVICMLLSAAFRAVGCFGLWSDRSFMATQIVLRLCATCCLCFWC